MTASLYQRRPGRVEPDPPFCAHERPRSWSSDVPGRSIPLAQREHMARHVGRIETDEVRRAPPDVAGTGQQVVRDVGQGVDEAERIEVERDPAGCAWRWSRFTTVTTTSSSAPSGRSTRRALE